MEDAYLKKITTAVILAILAVLTFFLLKPILLSIVVGFILAYIFTPIYKRLYSFTKSKNFSASLICIFLFLVIIIPFWFLTPIVLQQSIKIYFASQQIDFMTPLQQFFPSLFSSPEFTSEMGGIIQNFVTKMTSSLMNSLSGILVNFPTLFLHLLVVSFTFFFVLRDSDEIIEYVKSLLPFSKDVEKKLFAYTRGITGSVIYGQIIIGMIQGVLTAIGFFIFGVPNAMLLSLLAVIAGVLPILGTVLVWFPVSVYLYMGGNIVPAIGVAIFGLLSNTIDNFLRPMIVSKATNMHSGIVLIGMISGLFLFGVLGLILGPLILSYLIVILELYRNKKEPGFLIQREGSKKK
jgi:predicted PurR-regulated permease PerM